MSYRCRVTEEQRQIIEKWLEPPWVWSYLRNKQCLHDLLADVRGLESDNAALRALLLEVLRGHTCPKCGCTRPEWITAHRLDCRLAAMLEEQPHA